MTKLMLTAMLALGLGACEGMPVDGTGVDGAAGVDSGAPDTEAPCTEWGRVSVCPDGTIGCDAMVCLSHTPPACAPGPWPCSAK